MAASVVNWLCLRDRAVDVFQHHVDDVDIEILIYNHLSFEKMSSKDYNLGGLID